jgi:hypothetical protein
MSLTDKIKNLISDGKTQQAVDMLQAFLKEHGGADHQLLNQTLLLENQYKEVLKKAQLNIEDTRADINRINYSLLNLCDEAENFVTDIEKKAKNETDTEGAKNPPPNPLVVFGVILGFAALLFGGIFYFLKDAPASTPVKQSVEVVPLPKQQTVMPKNWSALTSVLNVNDRLYGNYKITIFGIKTETFDSGHDRLTFNLNLNCLGSSSGKCLGNYLTFRLTSAPNEEVAPESDRAFDIQSDKTTREETVSFIVHKSMTSAMLDAFYVDKPQSKATVKLLGN